MSWHHWALAVAALLQLGIVPGGGGARRGTADVAIATINWDTTGSPATCGSGTGEDVEANSVTSTPNCNASGLNSTAESALFDGSTAATRTDARYDNLYSAVSSGNRWFDFYWKFDATEGTVNSLTLHLTASTADSGADIQCDASPHQCRCRTHDDTPSTFISVDTTSEWKVRLLYDWDNDDCTICLDTSSDFGTTCQTASGGGSPGNIDGIRFNAAADAFDFRVDELTVCDSTPTGKCG